ncbi:MAG: hypothetical protein ABIO78_02015 [Thermoanaerobaculia bacterium]
MIYIDFECLKTTPPAPILFGVLRDLDGQVHLDQILVGDSVKGAAVARPGVKGV